MLDYGRFEASRSIRYGTLIHWETGLLDAFRPDPRRPRHRHRRRGPPGPRRPARGRRGSRSIPSLSGRAGGRFARRRGGARVRAHRGRARALLRSRVRPAGLPGLAAALAPTPGSASGSGSSPTATTTSSRRRRPARGVTFDWVIIAQQAGLYKPNEANFQVAFERLGLPRDRILHVAQSLFDDHVPAKRLGLSLVGIDRMA